MIRKGLIIGIIFLFIGASVSAVELSNNFRIKFQSNGEKPIADFSWEPEKPTVLDVIQFTDESYDPDGIIVSSGWSFGDGIWESKTPMPSNRRSLVTECVNNKIYAIGGRPAGTHGPDDVGTTEEYNPLYDSWNTMSSMNTRRSGMGSSVYNDKIYVFGGFLNGVLSTVEEYDPSIDSWTYKASLPGPKRRCCGVSTVGDRIYVIGGGTHPPTVVLDNVDIYDPVNDSWSSGSPMPTARACLCTIAIDDNIYAFGGKSETHAGTNYSTVEIYNTKTDNWTSGTPLPINTSYMSATYCKGKIFIIGGLQPTGISSTVQVYDPVNDTWTYDVNITYRRYCHSSATWDGKMYTFGGSDEDPDNETVHTMTDEFTPSTIASGEIVTHQYHVVGSYNVTLNVMDNEFNTDSIIKSIVVTINNPPNKPTIDGKHVGNPGVSYEYIFTTTDPNDNQVYYYVDWGDGSFKDWFDPFDSGENATASHAWSQGNFEISVIAKDEHGLESKWSDPFPITMPRNKAINSPFLNFLQSHPNLFPLLQKLIQQPWF